MDSRWQAFLEDAGAVIEDGRVAHFGNPAREIRIGTTGNLITDLSHLGFLTATGDDAAGFLQGQLTNDITEVDAARSQLSGYCNPQGRLLAILRIFLREQAYHLELPRALVDSTLERLRKYVLMSKVALEDGGDCLVRMGCAGPGAEEELKAVTGKIPEGIDEVVSTEGLTLIRIPGPVPRFTIYGKTPAMEKLWSSLDVRCAPVGPQVWERLDILAGLPAIAPETVAEFVPQYVNLDRVGGVSFSKGCYTGQEIIARLHYRGKTKRRMTRLHIACDEPPAPGTPLYAPRQAQAAGIVVRAAPCPDGGCDALASLLLEHHGKTLHLGGAKGPQAQARELPYAPD